VDMPVVVVLEDEHAPNISRAARMMINGTM
jgi:tRNA C32,U32 (ribose-2'-O)-methylase TrmJ